MGQREDLMKTRLQIGTGRVRGTCLRRRRQGGQRRDGDEAEALAQVLVGGAAFEQGERDQVQLSLQNQNQLPVPAHRPAAVHQALRRTAE